MQLVAYGAQDIYLTGNPQITFWKNLYRRHTHFSVESIEATFTGSPDFGKRVNCIISRMGDLAHKMYVRIKLPSVRMSSSAVTNEPCEFRWLDYLGEVLMKSVDIEIGGQRIDRHYSEWLHIFNELNLPIGLRDGYNKMVGHVPELNELKSVVGGATMDVPEYTMWVPLQFWFNRNPGLALPLIALQYHEVRCTIDFREKNECFWWNGKGSLDMGSLDASLFIDYVFLDTDERKKFAQAAHEYLFEQLQYTGEEALAGGGSKVKLNLNHPVKELVWVIQRDDYFNRGVKITHPTLSTQVDTIDYYKGSQHFNFTTDWDDTHADNVYFTSNIDLVPSTVPVESARLRNANMVRTVRKNPLRTFGMKLNGHDRLSEREGSYFDLVQPYQCHDNVPSQPGINVFSFALRPADQQPSGTCNFSRIDNSTLDVKVQYPTNNLDSKIKIFAVNYNVLRVMSGMGGTAYSN